MFSRQALTICYQQKSYLPCSCGYERND